MKAIWRLGLLGVLAVLVGCHSDPAGPPPGPPVTLDVTGGNGQKGPAGATLPVALTVVVKNNGTPIVGRAVTWAFTSGGGTIVQQSATDANGISSATVTLGPPGAQTVRATVDTANAFFALTGLAPSTNPILVGEVSIPPQYGIHDTYVRAGLAFVCAWNTGVIIYDVGDGRKGGSPSNPIEVGRLVTNDNGVPGGPAVHNAWWFHNPVNGEKKYLFVGQEGPATLFSTASGDLHVVDVSDLTHPVEVGSLRIAGAGVHNLWMDEAAQVLYAAYYNGGVVAIDVSGTLPADLTPRIKAHVLPGGAANTFVWGVMLANGALWVSDIVSGFWKLDPVTLATLGGGNNVAERWGSDLWVRGQYAYSGTWGGTPRNGNGYGDVVKVWQVGGGAPVLADSIRFNGVRTVSDLEVSDDGSLLVVTTERLSSPGLSVFDLADPAHPVLAGSVVVANGLHTGSLMRTGGRLYVYAAKNPGSPTLQVYDITR